MAKNKDTYRRMLAAAGLVSVLAYGCAGQSSVDHGGEPRSEEGQMAFTRLTNWTGTDLEADIYTINVDGSRERRLTDSPGLDGFATWGPPTAKD
jgi:hypothetical protein